MPATTGGFLCLLVGLSVAISASGHAAALLRADAERQLGGEASPLTETSPLAVDTPSKLPADAMV